MTNKTDLSETVNIEKYISYEGEIDEEPIGPFMRKRDILKEAIPILRELEETIRLKIFNSEGKFLAQYDNKNDDINRFINYIQSLLEEEKS